MDSGIYETPINYKSNVSAVSVNNTIFVTGGLFINNSNSTIVVNNMEKLDIYKDKQWSIIEMPMARVYHGIDSTFGMLYFAGGLSVTEQYGNLEKTTRYLVTILERISGLIFHILFIRYPYHHCVN